MPGHVRSLAVRNVLVTAAFLFTLLGLPQCGYAQEKQANCIGRIIIEGNDQTPNSAILRFVKMRPGQVLDYRELQTSVKALSDSGLFDRNEPPIVELLPDPLNGVFIDIRIRVKERPLSWVTFQIYYLTIAARHQSASIFLQAVSLAVEKLVHRR